MAEEHRLGKKLTDTLNKAENIKRAAPDQAVADTTDAIPSCASDIQVEKEPTLTLEVKEGFKKAKRITLRISHTDFENIVRLAEAEGLTYQTYITRILHKIATGQLKTA